MRKEIELFLDFLTNEKGRSANTTAAYRNDLTQFLRFLQDFSTPTLPKINRWPDITIAVVQEYLFFLQEEKEYASSTIARKIAAVKSYFHYLRERGVVDQDPCRELDLPKVQKNLPHSISPDQVERLLAEPAKDSSAKALRDKALLETLYATGMRVTELVNLNVEDIDLDHRTVVCGAGGKRSRTVPVYAEAVDALKKYVACGRKSLLVRGETEALFLNHRGRRLTRQGLWLIIKEYVEALDIQEDVTPQTLRHSFAAHLLNAGAGLHEVQERLGHASPTTTQVYRRVSGETADELTIDGSQSKLRTQGSLNGKTSVSSPPTQSAPNSATSDSANGAQPDAGPAESMPESDAAEANSVPDESTP